MLRDMSADHQGLTEDEVRAPAASAAIVLEVSDFLAHCLRRLNLPLPSVVVSSSSQTDLMFELFGTW